MSQTHLPDSLRAASVRAASRLVCESRQKHVKGHITNFQHWFSNGDRCGQRETFYNVQLYCFPCYTEMNYFFK